MSNYVQTTFFTPKDSLPPSNPAKTIFGAAYDVEFGNLSAAVASKYDTSSISAGPIAFALGSSVLPSITFTGQTGTGLYSNASGDLGHSTAGVARLVISGTTGNTSITGVLSVSSNIAATGTLSLTGQAGSNLNILPVGAGAALQSTLQYGADNNLYIDAPVTGTPTGSQIIFRNASAHVTLALSAAGNATFSAPTSGVTLSIGNPGSGVFGTIFGDGTADNRTRLRSSTPYALALSSGASGGNYFIGASDTTATPGLAFANNGGTVSLQITSAGNVTVSTPTSGTGLTVSGVAGSNVFATIINGAGVAGQSNGLLVNAGIANAADRAIDVLNQAGTTRLFGVFGDGHFALGYNATTSIITGSAAGNIVINAPSSGSTLTLANAANLSVIQINSSTTSVGNIAEIQIVRASTSTSIGQGTGIDLRDSSGGITATVLQHGAGNTQIYQFNGSWIERLRIDTSGNVNISDGNGTLRAIYAGVPQSANTTAALTDIGKCINAAGTITVPNAVFAAGHAFSIYNNTAGAITISAGITTMRLAGTATTGSRTLAQRGLATVWFESGTECVVSGSGLT